MYRLAFLKLRKWHHPHIGNVQEKIVYLCSHSSTKGKMWVRHGLVVIEAYNPQTKFLMGKRHSWALTWLRYNHSMWEKSPKNRNIIDKLTKN